jgi:hypothetical protein
MLAGSGAMLGGCSGVKREDFNDIAAKTSGYLQDRLDETSRNILYLASLAPSGHNSQPWRVRIETPHRWTVETDESRRLPAVDPEDRELVLSLGAFVENLSIAAGAAGFFADIHPTDADTDTVNQSSIQVTLHRDGPTGYPVRRLTSRRTVKHGHLSKLLGNRDIEILSETLDGRLFYFPAGSQHAECIREAAVENYRIQAMRMEAQEELVKWLRLNNREARKHRDGLSTEGMELAGIQGWYLRHIASSDDFLKESWRLKGIDMTAELAGQGAGWLIVTSPGRTRADLLETGRRFERMALLTRELGIGIHPMTQILEEKHGLSQFADHHGEKNHPQFVLRVGYLDRYPDPVSLRRPVDWFTSI